LFGKPGETLFLLDKNWKAQGRFLKLAAALV